MGRFAYFVPGATALADVFAGVGEVVGKSATGTCASVQYPTIEGAVGPKHDGFLVCEGCEVLRVEDVRDWRFREVDEDSAARRAGARRSQVLVGIIGEGMPGPGELARKVMVEGHAVELGDGNAWVIPCGRMFPSGTKLPESLVMRGGKLTTEVVEEFAAFSAEAEGLFWKLYGEHVPEGTLGRPDVIEPLSSEDCWRIAVMALGINYRVGADEVSALKLLRTDRLRAVLGAIVDEPGLRAFVEKKNTAA